MLPGGSHQRRPKHDAEAAPEEKQDEPASKYARIQWFVVLWLVCDNVLLTFGSLGKKSTPCASVLNPRVAVLSPLDVATRLTG